MATRASDRSQRRGRTDEHSNADSSRAGIDRRALVCFLLAALLLVLGIGVVLSHTGYQRAGFNGVGAENGAGTVASGQTVCQHREILPADTHELVTSLGPTTAAGGPPLTVTLRRQGRMLERVQVPRGWSGRATVPLATRGEHDDVDVCFLVGGRREHIAMAAAVTPPDVGGATVDGTPVGGSLEVRYFYSHFRSWWAYLPTALWRIGLGRGGWGGSWLGWTVLALMLAAVALGVHVTLRTIVSERGQSVRATAVAIALAAVAAAAAWSLVTPAFQAPDEIGHLAYAQTLAESAAPPVQRDKTRFSQELLTTMADLRVGAPDLHQVNATIMSEVEERHLQRDLERPLSRRGNDGADAATTEPPLYYALTAVPYTLAHGAGLTARIELMRLLSALMAGATAVFAFLFVRECLPRHAWAWSVGGLGAAFMPLVAFMSGSVNPDAMLFAVGVALLYCIARAFRRGLTQRLAVWTGVAIALGLLAKINFFGLLPGALIAVVLAARQSEGSWNGRVAQLAGTAIGVGLAPYLVLLALDLLIWDRGGILFSSASSTEGVHGLGNQFAFLWQVYLPRLPGQTPIFPSWVGRELFFNGFVGRFGALTVSFAGWVYDAALVLSLALAALALRAAVVQRDALRRRRVELLAYVLLVGGVLGLIAMAAMRGWNGVEIIAAAQGRYLLPLLGFFSLALTLAARGAGERWGRALGAVLVVIAIGWTLFAQMQTVEAFYS